MNKKLFSLFVLFPLICSAENCDQTADYMANQATGTDKQKQFVHDYQLQFCYEREHQRQFVNACMKGKEPNVTSVDKCYVEYFKQKQAS